MMVADKKLTHYRVTGKLGQGGMGEVYRATDLKLGREVAIKVLPESLCRKPEAVTRFEREAKALAALNHPNIASIHGFEAEQGTHFIVLELVEGETLAERLRRGPLSIEESLRVARQIAEALEAAHARGIIHRDLKPGNIKFTAEGRVKVLDFGLAKLAATPGSEDVTLKSEQTTPGAILGTPAYMSPEQARGQEVDKRTDVWAFGCCLFECLAGAKPFRGDTVTDLMAEVLKSDPIWSALPAETPREVLTLLRRSLEKDPRRRLSSLGDIAILLEDTQYAKVPKPASLNEERLPAPQPNRGNSLTSRFALLIGIASLLAGLAIAVLTIWRQARAAGPTREIRSLAVLPFEENTGDSKLAGLGKSIPAEIRSKLGSLENLQVVNAPAKIEQLRQQKKTEIEIAQELNVQALVLGELHLQGEALTLFVSVVDGQTGRNLVEPRRLTSSFGTVSELPTTAALELVKELKLQVTAAQRSGLSEPETRSSEAFLALHRGMDLMSRRHWEEAAAEFRKAYKLDTNFTAAWVQLASSQWVPVMHGGTTNKPAIVFERVLKEAERFNENQQAQAAIDELRLWIALIYQRDWEKVRRLYWQVEHSRKRAGGGMFQMSLYYFYVEGHLEEALQLNKAAIALEPDILALRFSRANLLLLGGRPQEGMNLVRAFLPEQIKSEDFSMGAMLAGDLPEAKERALRVLRESPNPSTRCNLAAIEAKLGQPNEAREILDGLEEDYKSGILLPFGKMALAYGNLGDFGAAQRWLRRGVKEGHGDWSTIMIRTEPFLRLFGEFSWYWELVDEMKFPPLQMDHSYYRLEQEMRYQRGGVRDITSPASTNETLRTVAVLPFVNMSSDKENEYLSDGITEEILNTLAGVPGLRVPARSSSFYFKEKKESVRKIAEELKVATVLEGGVRKAGNQLRITARLISVADGLTLWAGTYDRSAEDVLTIQSEVAQSVMEALRVKLLGMSGTNELRRGTDNLEAYDLFLRGRQLWNTRTAENIQRAIAYFEQAIEKDQNYAQAYAGLGSCYVVLPVYTRLTNPEVMPKARAAARRAIELNPALSEAHLVMGNSYYREGDFEQAEPLYTQALKLNTNSAMAHMWMAELLIDSGRSEPALAEMQLAQAAEPLSPVVQAVAARVLAQSRKHGQALAQVEKSFQLAPDFTVAYLVRGLTRMMQKNYLEAIPDLEKAYKAGAYYNGSTSGHLGLCYAKLNRSNDAQRLLDELKSSRDPERSSIYVARIYYAMGAQDEAFSWLERAANNKNLGVQRLKFNPTWDEVTSDPRYDDLLKRHGLNKPTQPSPVLHQ